MRYRFRPLGAWPGRATPAAARRRSQFKAGYEVTLDLLFSEAEKLGARDLVLQVDLAERDIRTDGLPRANARFGSNPGVIVSFDSVHGPLTYPTDVFTQWRDNLRAIALALESLRAVDRYGVTRRGEQYTGWKALPPPRPPEPALPTPEDARWWIRQQLRLADNELGHSVVSKPRDEYRALAKILHPDAGGDPDSWRLLDAARQALATAGLL